jgi:cephalosporin-C deacetylase-like acetyl esterase
MNQARVVEKTPADLRALLGIAARDRAPLATLRRVSSREVDIEAVEVASAPKVWVPAWLFLPRGRKSDKPVVLVVDAGGRNRRWTEGDLYQSLAGRGFPVCVADVRGIGDLAPEFGPGEPGYTRPHQSEEDYAWGSLILGRPLVGQRVSDILALAAGLGKHPALGGRRVVVAARSKLTVPALFAAALDKNISELYLAGGLVSFQSIVETENYDHSFANFVPGLLRHTDLPGVAATLAPRRVTLAGTVDAEGRAMESPAVRGVYSGAHVMVRDKADWDIDALSGWNA